MWFVFGFLVSFLLFSSIRESKYNKVGILFINTTDFFFPSWMWSHSNISLELRPERGLKTFEMIVLSIFVILQLHVCAKL